MEILVSLDIPRSCPLKWKYTLQLLKQLRFSRNFRLTENFRDYYKILYRINRTTILLTSCMCFGEVKYMHQTRVQFSSNYLFFIWPLPWFHFYYHSMPKWWTLGSHFLDFNIFLLVVIRFLITVIHNILQRDDNPNITKRLTFCEFVTTFFGLTSLIFSIFKYDFKYQLFLIIFKVDINTSLEKNQCKNL